MPRIRVHAFSVSIDGVGGLAMHEWVFPTRTFQRLQGNEGGTTGIDDNFAARGFAGIGAWIIGRNMFGPTRGPWPDESWKGWWGDNPPYHTQVFVLTHHARPALDMEGGTTFHFVTEGIHAALRRAIETAGGQDVRVGGGVATIRQYLRAGLIDEMHLAISPALLGTGESLLSGIDLVAMGFERTEHAVTANAMHVVLARHGAAR